MNMSQQETSDMSYGGGSMYLSFDSNSTISNAAFKTMEAANDFPSTIHNESNCNTTLEAKDVNNGRNSIGKALGVLYPLNNKPLQQCNRTLIQEHSVFSSTPTKDMLAQDWPTPVENNKCNESKISNDENKENRLPDMDRSLSPSIETVSSVIEVKKMNTSELPIKEECKDMDGLSHSVQSVKLELHETSNGKESNSNLVKNEEQIASKKSKTFANNQCERKYNSKDKSKSKEVTDLEFISRIPHLLEKTLKISEPVKIKKDCLKTNNEGATKLMEASSNNTTSKRRVSLLPLCKRRPYSAIQCIPGQVKTTLNSPARKIPRKSFAPINIKGINSLDSRRKSLQIPVKPTNKMTRYSVLPRAATIEKKVQLKSTVNADEIGIAHSRLLNNENSNNNILSINFAQTKLNSLAAISENFEESKPNNKLKIDKMSRIELRSKFSRMYSCSLCSREFPTKSLLDAHKRSHEQELRLPLPPLLKKETSPSCSESQKFPLSESVKCKYCDKKFALVRALHIHLMLHCTKIPAGCRRNLRYTEMNHVEKAQLPTFSKRKTYPKKSPTKFDSSQTTEREGVVGQKLLHTFENKEGGAKVVGKGRKALAHSGVFCTPRKSIRCHICKKVFGNALDYTHHCLAMHSSAANHKSPKRAWNYAMAI